ncbi:hypothetical protein EcSzw1_111 [Escherichia phage EcSzw_1]|nr:hypothetical protein EcSzw2_111 [Escherichia phage EcSzw-2]QAY01047.1 hypothetical protein EcSzw1_111 [Escherichia phage EcSzw_1]
MFYKALREDVDVAVRILLHMRDVREGMGERKAFRTVLLQAIEDNILDSFQVLRIMDKISELGRFDDFKIFVGTRYETDAFKHLEAALLDPDTACLAAKWLPRVKPRHKQFVKRFCKFANLSEKEYRTLLSALSDTVEQKISTNNFGEIDYSKIPSLAAARYQKLFSKKDGERYAAYVEALSKGETKINAGAVYPYDVLKSVQRGQAQVANEQWKALPNWMADGENILCMTDVSCSMTWETFGSVTALDIGVSLALYVSERNTGCFKDELMIYSDRPHFITLSGTLQNRHRQIMSHVEYGSTNLQAAFDRILEIGVRNNLTQAAMPSKLIIFSDMEFNQVDGANGRTNFEVIRSKYEKAGYEMPQLVFWYLANRNGHCEVSVKDNGVAMVSGFSPATLKALLGGEKFDPISVMLKAVMIDRYIW